MLPRWLERLRHIRRRRLRLAQVGAWILVTLIAVLVVPPVDPERQQSLRAVGAVIVAGLIGIVMFLAVALTRARHARIWAFVALLALSGAVGAWFLYQSESGRRTCRYLDTRLVIGSEYTAAASAVLVEEPGRPCQLLIHDFAGELEAVWTRESIRESEQVLQGLYLACVFLFGAGIVSVTQSIYCAEEPRASGERA